MNKRIFILSFFIALIFFFSLAVAEENTPDIQIKLIYPEHLEIDPGQTVTFSFLVINQSASEAEFKEDLELPPNWQLIIPPNWFKLSENDQQVRLMSFLIPTTCTAGQYPIKYSLSNTAAGKSYSSTVNVTVLSESTVKSMIEEKPLIVIAGEKYTVKMRYMNTGNCSVLLHFKVNESPDYPLVTTPEQMDLQPGQSEVLTLSVQTDGKLISGISHLLDIKAKDKNSSLVFTEDNVLVDIIPKITGEYSLYRRIPSQVKVMTGLQTQASSTQPNPILQLEFTGSGKIDGEGKNKISWLCMTPNPFNPDLQPGSFQLNYTNDLMDLNLGNRSSFLSPLTGRWDNLFNLNLGFHPKNSAFGFIYPGRTEFGTYYSYRFNQFVNLKLNFLNANNTVNNIPVNSKIISLESELKPLTNSVLNLEGGIDLHEGASGDSFAYRFDLHRLSPGTFNYSLEKIYAAPGYYGNYNDSDNTNGTISYLFYDKFPASVSYHSYRSNLSMNDAIASAHDDLSFNGNLSYILSPKTVFSLTLDKTRKKDSLAETAFDNEIHSWKLGLQHIFPLWRFASYVEGGNFKNNLSPQDNGSFTSVNFNFSYIPDKTHTYSLYANLANHFIEEAPETKQVVGAAVNLQFSNNFAMNMDCQQSNFGGGSFGTNNLSFNFSYKINPLSVVLQGSRDSAANSFTATLLANYILGWNMPIAKRKDLGVLRGRIFDAEKPDNPPIVNMILRANGITAVTNEQGEFVFSSLPPGVYSLLIDKSLAGLNMVTIDKFPLSVEVKKGEISEIKVGMVSAAKITGKVVFLTSHREKGPDNLYNSNNNLYTIDNGEDPQKLPLNPDQLEETRVLADSLVEITDGKETFRQMTDDAGAFSFAGMRPGRWTLKIYGDNLPPHYYFDTAGLEFDLNPGEVKEITVKALPQVRPVQIIEEGEIGVQDAGK